MFTLSIVAMLAGAATLPNYNLPPLRATVRTAKCAGACANRYRLPSSQQDADSSKYRALNEDGTDCNITRAKICRKQPRTWVRAAY